MLKGVESYIGTAIFFAASVVAPLAAGAGPSRVGSIGLDEAVFWDGGRVDWSPLYSLPFAQSNEAVDRCDTIGPCFEYTLEVEDEGGKSLRVALDTPMRNDGFEWVVLDPSGARRARVTNTNQYTREAFVAGPAPGVWTIRVAPFGADDAPFRMRAKLESSDYSPQPDANRMLLPNLRVFRIWEFGFAAPALNNGSFPGDDMNPPIDVAGFHPVSCTPADQGGEESAEKCLRYSFGLANVGEGNFDIRWTNDATGATTPMIQCMQSADGAPMAKEAGTGHFDASHGHWHYDDIIFHRLYVVTDPATGEMAASGDGKKLGYSPADQGFAEWERFMQALPGTSGSAGNCVPGSDRRLGMSRGWGDAYRYQRPGNYVEFGTNGDGYYVVQTSVDPEGNVAESDETDNTAYAYIHVAFDVTGDETIEILESGLGESPWDPAKRLFDPWYEHPHTTSGWLMP